MIDVGDIRPRGSIPKGPMADHLDLVVHALQGAIGHADPGPRQHPIEMGAEHPRELLKELQPAMGCPPEPLAQVGLGPGRAAVVPEPAEVLLEEAPLHDGTVQAQEPRQACALLAPEVLRIAEPEEAGALELGLLPPGHLPPGLAPHLIHGSVEGLAEMNAIKDQRGLREVQADRVDVDRPHVTADRVDGASPPEAQPGEEAVHGSRGPVPPDPHDAPALEVIDDREILLSLTAAHLIETQEVQGPPRAMLKPPEDRALDHGRHSLPVEAEVGGPRRPVQDPGQGGHGSEQGVGHPLPLVSPGDPLHAQSAAGAPDPGGGIHQLDQVLAHCQIPPSARWASGRGNPLRLQPALATAETAGAQPFDVDDQHALPLPLLDLDHGVGFQSERFSDKGFPAHRLSASFLQRDCRSRITQDVRCASTFRPLAH